MDSLSGGEEEQDLNSFSHIFESEISTLPHFSTPVNKSTNQDGASIQQKRPIKASQNNTTSKRVKSSESSGQSLKLRSPPRNETDISQEEEEDTDYIEAPTSFKMESLVEQEEPKQFLESNGSASVIEPNHQDQGRFRSHILHIVMHVLGLKMYILLYCNVVCSSAFKTTGN